MISPSLPLDMAFLKRWTDHQVGLQNAPFAVPLIAEPESKYYTHPILVLDFQSLYPSVMIAYNICFSTCLGRVEKFKGTDKFGFTELKVADGLLELLKDYLTGDYSHSHASVQGG